MKEKRKRLNWKQACELMGCGKTKFYDLVNSGELTAYRAGRRGIWVYEDDVVALIMQPKGEYVKYS